MATAPISVGGAADPFDEPAVPEVDAVKGADGHDRPLRAAPGTRPGSTRSSLLGN